MEGGLLVFVVLLNLLYPGEGFTDLKSSDEEIVDSCALEPTLVPKLYEIKIDLDYYQRKFYGEVSITGQVNQETKRLLLDSSVNVTDTALYDRDGYTYLVLQNNQTESMLEIEFEDILLPNKEYILLIRYEGEIRKLYGVFGKNFSTSQSDSYFVATEFQPSHASFCFPCVDRPMYKAQFTLNISREANHVALSNMPLESSHLDIYDDNKVWDSFKISPFMSTYTFAFVVGDFVPVRSEDCTGNTNIDSFPLYSEDCNVVDSQGDQTVPEHCNGDESKGDVDSNHRPKSTVWTFRGLQRLGCIAKRFAPFILKSVENYTGIPFELPKLDHVALPLYASVAMEHWGVITYKQEMILMEEDSTSVKNKFGLKWIMAHEVIHQWFGNLVTCSSWRYTWLNEGITSFLHFLIPGKVFPELDMLGLMISEDVYKLMDDEVYSPVELTQPDCIMELSASFSMASYYKGASFIRMIYYLMGDDSLQKGLRSYLNKNNHISVTQEDLWVNFEKLAETKNFLPLNTSLNTVMQTWTDNYGFPVVTVTRKNETLSFEQGRLEYFNLDEYPDQAWWIPLTYTTSTERNFSNTLIRQWMDPDDQVTSLSEEIQQDEWVIFNIKQSGYYRVIYDDVTWTLLCKQLMEDHTVISPLSKANLIDDSFALASLNRTNYFKTFSLIKYLVKETSYYPWASLIRNIDPIEKYMKNSHLNQTFHNFILGLLDDIYTKLSKERKDINDNLLYLKLLTFSCSYGHKGCEEKAKETMEKVISGDKEYIKIHQDEIYQLMCAMIRLGGQEIWDIALEMYATEFNYKRKEELRFALQCTIDKNVIKKWAINHIKGVVPYNNIDLADLASKEAYCYIIEILKNKLSEEPDSIVHLISIIEDISARISKKCINELDELVMKYADEQDRENIMKTLNKIRRGWPRLHEVEEFLYEEENKLEGRIGINDGETIDDEDLQSSPHRRQLNPDNLDDTVDISYPHNRQSQDYDYESRHGQANQISSAVSTEFNTYILILSVLPSPFYLTYLIFAPFL